MQVMLAGKYSPKHLQKHLPVFADVKLDGIRAFIKDGYAWTRSVKPVRSTQIQSWIAHNKDFLNGLDGEFICGEPTDPNCYQITDSSVMSFNKPHDDIRFYVFDTWDYQAPFHDRREYLESLDFSGLPFRVELVETKLLWTIEDIDEYMEQQIALGHEGIMLRNQNAYYKEGRGGLSQCELIKRKDGRWIDCEARIIGVKEQLTNENEATLDNLGKTERSGHKENLVPSGVLGAFQVVGYWPDDELVPSHLRGKQFESSVGTGLNDLQRIQWWREPPLDKIMKMKFFSGGIKDKPRFPVFLGLRDPDDMDPKDVQQLSLF